MGKGCGGAGEIRVGGWAGGVCKRQWGVLAHEKQDAGPGAGGGKPCLGGGEGRLEGDGGNGRERPEFCGDEEKELEAEKKQASTEGVGRAEGKRLFTVVP